MSDESYMLDDERTADFAPGTIFEDDYGQRFVVTWNGRVADFVAKPSVMRYCDPEAELIVLHTPEAPLKPLVIRENYEAVLRALPIGTVFTEHSPRLAPHRFVKVAADYVVLDNGSTWASLYTDPGFLPGGFVVERLPSGLQQEDGALFTLQELILGTVAA